MATIIKKRKQKKEGQPSLLRKFSKKVEGLPSSLCLTGVDFDSGIKFLD